MRSCRMGDGEDEQNRLHLLNPKILLAHQLEHKTKATSFVMGVATDDGRSREGVPVRRQHAQFEPNVARTWVASRLAWDELPVSREPDMRGFDTCEPHKIESFGKREGEHP